MEALVLWQALRLIDLYTKKGFDPESKRIYIKVSSGGPVASWRYPAAGYHSVTPATDDLSTV